MRGEGGTKEKLMLNTCFFAVVLLFFCIQLALFSIFCCFKEMRPHSDNNSVVNPVHSAEKYGEHKLM